MVAHGEQRCGGWRRWWWWTDTQRICMTNKGWLKREADNAVDDTEVMVVIITDKSKNGRAVENKQ